MIQAAFPDGIIWLEIGRNPENLLIAMRALGRALGQGPDRYDSVVLAIAGFILLALAVVQSAQESVGNTDFSARFSYESVWVGPSSSTGLRTVCFAFARNGQYRILRQTNSGATQAFQGKLGKSQQNQIQRMLNSAAFRDFSGNGAGVVVKGADTFVAKVPRDGKEQYVTWTNRDRRDPFPAPAAEMIEWMRSFDTAGGQSIRPETLNICPRTARPLLPSSSN